MLVTSTPDPLTRMGLLGRQMALEPDAEAPPVGDAPAPCGHSPAELRRAFAADAGDDRAASLGKARSLGMHDAVMPGGGRIRLLKTMLTSACERNCNYCPFRAGRDMRRATLTPDEMARTFADVHRAGDAQGLFLSSGIIGGGVRTQDRLLATADILRNKLGFRGYLHLKLMPGAQHAQVLRAMALADRVSLNLEAPSQPRLTPLAPRKIFLEELLQPLTWAADIRRTQPTPRRGRWASFVTQFVVGAHGSHGESDVELLETTALLTQRGLQRAYFSAFKPVTDTPLEQHAPENPWREHRLYQASFLLRDYGFDFEDLPFADDGRLPLHIDPKLGWADANLRDAPVELNTADRRALLRIPGIGPQSADAILAARRVRRLTDLPQLARLGIRTRRAAGFVLLNGRRPAAAVEQMALFPNP
jgi:predicted DNA-binding helix-hairpin-helix protein